MKLKFSNLVWGTFLLLAATFVIVNQLSGFASIGVGSIIAAILALAFFVQCIADLQLALLPIPIVVLYIIFRTTLNLPSIPTWTLILAAVLTTIGLSVLFPRKRWNNCCKSKHQNKQWGNNQAVHEEVSSGDNNPFISVNFGEINRRLQADSLETAQLKCNFGALEIFFDRVELSPNGAYAEINCSFGAIKLFVPRHWQIIDRIDCSLGGVDIEKNFSVTTENAPKFTLSGSVSFGGIEVRYL